MKKSIIAILVMGVVGVSLYSFYDKKEENVEPTIPTKNIKSNNNLESDDSAIIKENNREDVKEKVNKHQPEKFSQAKKEEIEKKLNEQFELRRQKYIAEANSTKDVILEFNYLDEEKRLIQPYEEISDEEIPWDIQTVDPVVKLNMSINYQIPIKTIDAKQLYAGVKEGKLGELSFSPADRKEPMSYRDCELENYSFDQNIKYLRCENGAYGYVTLELDLNSNSIDGNFSYMGRNEIIKTENGKGYIYGVYE